MSCFRLEGSGKGGGGHWNKCLCQKPLCIDEIECSNRVNKYVLPLYCHYKTPTVRARWKHWPQFEESFLRTFFLYLWRYIILEVYHHGIVTVLFTHRELEKHVRKCRMNFTWLLSCIIAIKSLQVLQLSKVKIFTPFLITQLCFYLKCTYARDSSISL